MILFLFVCDSTRSSRLQKGFEILDYAEPERVQLNAPKPLDHEKIFQFLDSLKMTDINDSIRPDLKILKQAINSLDLD